MTERNLLRAVARADLILSEILRRLPVIAVLAAALLLAALLAWGRVGRDPYAIDYDAPGVDITSEGPEGDYTDEWGRW